MAEEGRRRHAEQIQKVKEARKISELFKGRIKEEEATKLLEENGWDLDKAIDYVFKSEPATVATLLGSEDARDRIERVTKDEVLRNLASRHEIGSSARQFSCQNCSRSWWYRVPNRKPVATCKKCNTKYDAIPIGQEWGWAEFNCTCGNSFTSFGWMGNTKCECFKCGTECLPTKILPPRRRRQRRTDQSHVCNNRGCYNNHGHVHSNAPCVHPKSQPPEILVASTPHISTGSTVNTFLSQDDLDTPFETDLESIIESDNDTLE